MYRLSLQSYVCLVVCYMWYRQGGPDRVLFMVTDGTRNMAIT